MGSRRSASKTGTNKHLHRKIDYFAASQRHKRKIIRYFSTFEINLTLFNANAEDENDIFRDFVQGRRQEFFQGRALGGSRGGLPSHFSISKGGLNPDFWSLQWSKWKNFRARGAMPPPCLCLPTPLVTTYIEQTKIRRRQCQHTTCKKPTVLRYLLRMLHKRLAGSSTRRIKGKPNLLDVDMSTKKLTIV